MVAMFVAILIFAALATAMVRNNKGSLENQRQTQLVSVLQQQIENVHQLLTQNYAAVGFAGLALSSNPAQGVDSSLPGSPTDPNDFITPYVTNFVTANGGTAERFLIESNYNSTSEGTIDGGTSYAEVLNVDPTNGKIPPLSYVDLATGTSYTSLSSIPAGDMYATIYTYVTIAPVGVNASLSTCPSTNGTGTTANDVRRVIVAAKLSQPSTGAALGSGLVQYASTLIGDPIPSNQCQGSAGLRIGLNIQ
jgi:hypothetical protein